MKSIVLLLIVGLLQAQADTLPRHQSFLLEQSPLRCNSLKGYSRFLLAPQYAISDSKSSAKVEEMLVTQLERIGKVVCLPTNDVTGFGNAEGILVFDIQQMKTVDGGLLSNSLGSLALYTSLSGASGCGSGKMEIWKAQGISSGTLKEDRAEDYTRLLQPLLQQFIEDFRREGEGSIPTFYLYTNSKH